MVLKRYYTYENQSYNTRRLVVCRLRLPELQLRLHAHLHLRHRLRLRDARVPLRRAPGSRQRRQVLTRTRRLPARDHTRATHTLD